MEELSPEDLQQLEERLYSQVHYAAFEDNSNTFDQQTQNNTETSLNCSKYLSKRYWTNKRIDETQQIGDAATFEFGNKIVDKTKKCTNNMKRTQLQNQPNDVIRSITKQTNQNHNNKNVRNPFAKPNPKGANKNKIHNQSQTKQVNHNGGPLAEKLQKIQRVSQYHNKKQKANNAHAKMMSNPKVVATINLDLDSDNNEDDEVVHVPLPPPVVVSIDDSDDDKITATDELSLAKKQPSTLPLIENASRCGSPASVISHDDFLGQSDRLLLVNNNADSFSEGQTTSALLKRNSDNRRASNDDIECIGTFIKPNALVMKSKETVAGTQDYRVGSSEFRAVDVYESESDIVSDGVYSKAAKNKTQSISTSVQNCDRSSDDDDCELNDIKKNSETSKTKRLRKRRASTSIRSSESNGGVETSDSDDENNGVVETALPFVYRGIALEGQKSKKKRKRVISTVSTACISDKEFVETLNSLAKGNTNNENVNNDDENSDSDTRDKWPTARDIAEQVLNSSSQLEDKTHKPAENLPQVKEEPVNEVIEVPSTTSALITNDEDKTPEIADDVEKILLKINEFNEKEAQEEFSDGEAHDFNVSTGSHILAASDVSTMAAGLEDADKDADDNVNNIKYFTGFSPGNFKCITDGCGWNEEMRRFYNYSWGGENFREDTVLRSLKRNPHLWRISNVDRFPYTVPRSKCEKCMNCLSFGHSRSKCPKPKRPLACYMCGEKGHLEARCPNTRCLRCGSETMSFVQSCRKCIYWNNHICPICKLRGHSLNDCPDKWRRYHSTTKPNEFPNPKVIYNRRRYCCFCGTRGHLSDECRKAFYRSEFPLIASEIKSFEKSYDDVFRNPHPEPGIKCRLLYDPNLMVNFTLAERTSRSQMYGRFLNAVGLGKFIGAKNNVNPNNPTSVTITGNYLTKTLDKRSQLEVSQASEQNTLNKTKPKETTELKETASIARLKMPPPPTPMLTSSIDCDSDSNYSFSEHFEVSSSLEPLSKSVGEQSIAAAPLPDFIPLSGGNIYHDTSSLSEVYNTLETGISAKFVEAPSDDDQEMDVADDKSQADDQFKQCQAKIFISNVHYRYFQSNAGQEYLCKVLPEYELTGSLEKTSAGHALFLTGIPKNQEKFQQALLVKYEELNNVKAQQQMDNLVPKNVKPLIRFLRDSINQLYSNLGSATDLYKRLHDVEKLQTKVGIKSADRIRRTLNMIFLGQAGLHNGDAHFEILLKALRTLLNEFEGNEKTPQIMREEINASWRMLFTSYDHKRYANLLTTYIQLPLVKRNRLPALQIEANILGRPVIDVSLTKEQKERLNDITKDQQEKAETKSAPMENRVEEPLLTLNVLDSDLQSKQQVNKKSTGNQNQNHQSEKFTPTNLERKDTQEKVESTKTNSESIIQNQQQPQAQNEIETNTAVESQPKSTSIETYSEIDHEFCQILLTQIETTMDSQESGVRIEAAKMGSRFWSSKSLTYLLDIIKSVKSSNSPSLVRLERIYQCAVEGKLSFVNHSDLHKIYQRTVKK